MKLICNEKHRQKLETFFARYQELDIILEPTQMTEPGISGKELLLKNAEGL